MEQNKLLEIKNIIQDADQVLIGIGEVWNLFGKSAENKTAERESVPENDYQKVLTLDEESEKKQEILAAYENLFELVKEKPYFVVTMNTDDVIYESSFNREQIVAPCGSVHRLQCQQHILEAFETEPIFEKLKANKVKTGKLWTMEENFPPRCPACGLPLKLNTIDTKGYLEEGYLPQWKAYTGWLTRTLNKKLCVLELGVSFAHPSVIRFPFEKTVFYNKKAALIRVNEKFHQLPEDLREKGIAVQANAVEFIRQLKEV